MDIKSASQPKLYAELMTIRLAQLDQEVALPDQVSDQLVSLQNQVTELKNLLTQLQNQPASPARPAPVKPAPSSYKLDKGKVLAIMSATMQDAQQSRAYLDALKGAWNEILDSISPQDRALLLGSEPVLANADSALLAFETAFSAEQVMKRGDLNTIFGNIMSQAAGFSPTILAVPKADFQAIRAEFAQLHKADAQPQAAAEAEAPNPVPEQFQFLAEKIEVVDD